MESTHLVHLNSCFASMSEKIQSAMVLVSDIAERTEAPPSLKEQRELLSLVEELGDAASLVEDANEMAQRVFAITGAVEEICVEAQEEAQE